MCRRWRRLAASPGLLGDLAARLAPQAGLSACPAAQGTRFLLRLQAFVSFLHLRAAAHLRSLHLVLLIPPAASPKALDAAFAALRTALTAAPCLSELRIDADQEVKASSWVASLASLRRLELRSSAKLRFTAQLGGHTALRELVLEGCPLRVRAHAHLPASLTRLHLGGDAASCLPHQASSLLNGAAPVWGPQCVGCALYLLEGAAALAAHIDNHCCAPLCMLQVEALSQLACLSLAGASYAADAYCHLAQLSGLQQLALTQCQQLPAPATLALLTGLKGLRLRQADLAGSSKSSSAALQAALAALTQLTLLDWQSEQRLASLPPALAGLSRLQRLDWGLQAPAHPRLPAGSWLPRLVHLAVPADVAASSLQVLTAAWQLERLEVTGFAVQGASRAGHLAIVPWASLHKALQTLGLQLASVAAADEVGLAAAVEDARRRKPGLRIAFHF